MRFASTVLLLALLLAGCQRPVGTAATFDSAGQPSVIRVPEHPAANRPLVIYGHHFGGRETDITEHKLISQFADGLVARGFFVAASRAHGDAWGNSESVDAYVALARDVKSRHRTGDVLLVGESMGGLPTLKAWNERLIPDAVGWVGISAVTDLATMRGFDKQIAASGARRAAGERPRSPALVFASEDDRVVPSATQADPLHGHGVEVVRCEGPHLYDNSCRQAGAVADFFARQIRER